MHELVANVFLTIYISGTGSFIDQDSDPIWTAKQQGPPSTMHLRGKSHTNWASTRIGFFCMDYLPSMSP